MTNQSSRGVKFSSILNQLEHYHVRNPGSPSCLAHDLFERIVQYDLMLAINYFVNKKLMTFDVLNLRLQKFRFCNEVRFEKVPIIKKSEKLGGSASENMRLLLILPFAVYDLIDTTIMVWKMILHLREICCLCLSVNISIEQVAYLQSLLDEHIDLRKTLFNDVKLPPKHHYVLHYPGLIIKYGPLRHLWTLRFKSKHRHFKIVLRHGWYD